MIAIIEAFRKRAISIFESVQRITSFLDANGVFFIPKQR